MPQIRSMRAFTREAHAHRSVVSVGTPSSSAEEASKANGATWMGRLCDWSTNVNVSTSGLSQAVSFPLWQPKAKDSVARSYPPGARRTGARNTSHSAPSSWRVGVVPAVAPLLALGVDVHPS